MRNNWIINNLGLKILSVSLAFIAWFYINAEIQRIDELERQAAEPPYTQISKELPVRVDVIGKPAAGYKVKFEEIRTSPRNCLMIGPKYLLDTAEYVFAEPVDVSGKARTFTTKTYLRSAIDGTRISDNMVSITIPIDREN